MSAVEGLASGLPERRHDTRRYGPLVLAAARVAGVRGAVRADEVLAVLTDDQPDRLPSMTWGELVAVVADAVRLTHADRRNWWRRAAARGFTYSGFALGPSLAASEAVADDALADLAAREDLRNY